MSATARPPMGRTGPVGPSVGGGGTFGVGITYDGGGGGGGGGAPGGGGGGTAAPNAVRARGRAPRPSVPPAAQAPALAEQVVRRGPGPAARESGVRAPAVAGASGATASAANGDAVAGGAGAGGGGGATAWRARRTLLVARCHLGSALAAPHGPLPHGLRPGLRSVSGRAGADLTRRQSVPSPDGRRHDRPRPVRPRRGAHRARRSHLDAGADRHRERRRAVGPLARVPLGPPLRAGRVLPRRVRDGPGRRVGPDRRAGRVPRRVRRVAGRSLRRRRRAGGARRVR